MTDFLRRRPGFAALFAFGALLGIGGPIQNNAAIVVVGAIVAVIGAIGVVPRELKLPLGGGVVWRDGYKPAVEALRDKVEGQAAPRSGGDVTVHPGTAHGRIETYPPTVTVEPASPEQIEFIHTAEDLAKAIADSIRIEGTGSFVQAAPTIHGEGTVTNPEAADEKPSDE